MSMAAALPIRLFVTAAVTLPLLWFVALVTFSGVTRQPRPDLAVRYGWSDPPAMAALALRIAADGEDRVGDYAEALAQAALRRDSTLSSAYRLLGLAAEERGDEEQAARLMTQAAYISKRDLHVELWLAEHHERRGAMARAIEHYDRALRAHSEIRPVLFERLAERLERDGFAAPLASVVVRTSGSAGHADWGYHFLNWLVGRSPDLEAPGRLLDELEALRWEVDPNLGRRLVPRLLRAGRFDLANREYRRLVGERPRAGIVDGTFEGPHLAPPFGWDFGATGHHSATVEAAPDGEGHALRVTFDEDAPRYLLRQTLLLPPGNYTLSGRARSARLDRARPPIWAVLCVGRWRPIGEIRFSDLPVKWSEFSVRFTVPGDCQAQLLVLTRPRGLVAGEGEVFFDDLALSG